MLHCVQLGEPHQTIESSNLFVRYDAAHCELRPKIKDTRPLSIFVKAALHRTKPLHLW